MTHIFISYSRRDKAIADYIAAQLRNRGAEVFIDYQKLVAGENFIGRLGGEIVKSDYFVLLVSPRSVASQWVKAEVAWAFTNEKPIVPVLLEPASLADLFFLVNLEQVDFTRWSVDGNVTEAIGKLAAALGLPNIPVRATPVPKILSQPVENDEPEPAVNLVVFAREDLSEMFFAANEIAGEDPEQAMFLLQQVVEIDAGFMKGQAQEFVKRQTERLKPLRLKLLLEKAESARFRGEWEAMKRFALDMIGLDKSNADAKRLIALSDANLPCEPVYKQAEIAAGRGRWKAVLNLLHDVRESCPDYGDPSGLFLKAMAEGSNLQLPMLAWLPIPAGKVDIEGKVYPVKAFQMAKYPVTNAQFRLFTDDPNGYQNPYWWDFSDEARAWRKQNPKPHAEHYLGDTLPRVYVCWYEALAFCRWLSAALNLKITLPTETQWQRAAQGDDKRQYPWGNEFDATKCNTRESGIGQPTPVDCYPAGASPYGVMDMSGNVREWCLNDYSNLDYVELEGTGARVLRGGSWVDLQVNARYRFQFDPSYLINSIGFRCALSS